MSSSQGFTSPGFGQSPSTGRRVCRGRERSVCVCVCGGGGGWVWVWVWA